MLRELSTDVLLGLAVTCPNLVAMASLATPERTAPGRQHYCSEGVTLRFVTRAHIKPNPREHHQWVQNLLDL